MGRFDVPGRHMHRHSITIASVTVTALLFGTATWGQSTTPSPSVPKRAVLHNGWRLTPAGTHQRTGDMLIGSALSPDGKTLAFVNAGFNEHHLYLTDSATGAIRQSLPIKSAWNGIAWSKDGSTLYVAGGGQPMVHVFARKPNGDFAAAAPFTLPGLTNKGYQTASKEQAYVSGLAVSRDGASLYVANFATDTVYALALPDGRVVRQQSLGENAHPYCLRISPDGKSLYATEGALGKIAVLNPDDLSVTGTIQTDSHPNDLILSPDGRMFVSCGNSSTVVAIDAATQVVKERIRVTLTPKSPAGATPNGLALSPDGRTLYVANADNNAVAVVDVSRPNKSAVAGFIPTGWYPTSVNVSPDGGNLIIGSGKGTGAGPNSPKLHPQQARRSSEDKYIYAPTLFFGMISTLPVPDRTALAAYTRQVLANTPYRDAVVLQPTNAPKPGASAIPSRLGDPSPIKYILYIIKENRTYDQVLGDLKKNGKPYGNGDPDLTLFGENVTPNIHELARQYVLLDNLRCSGDVSGNGHPWSTGAYGTDLGERAWMLAYSGRAEWPMQDVDLYPPVGRIWDLCERAGLSYVSYYYTWTTSNTHQHMPKIWEENLNKLRDFENADLFAADLKRYEAENSMPRLMLMSLREDHTEGTSPGSFTPQACAASNDLGLGKIVEACSHSKFWKEMAIFVIEDDAQDGPDHVDAHRTEALVISPYTRRGKIDSTAYTTVSMLRSMELILGLQPMSQYDASTRPMYASFGAVPDTTPYTAIPARINLMAKNSATAYGAERSRRMDFTDVDRLSARQVVDLNEILWHSIKGVNVAYPAVKRSPLFLQSGRSVTDEQADAEDPD